jgi:hypothetical protein
MITSASTCVYIRTMSLRRMDLPHTPPEGLDRDQRPPLNQTLHCSRLTVTTSSMHSMSHATTSFQQNSTFYEYITSFLHDLYSPFFLSSLLRCAKKVSSLLCRMGSRYMIKRDGVFGYVFPPMLLCYSILPPTGTVSRFHYTVLQYCSLVVCFLDFSQWIDIGSSRSTCLKLRNPLGI